MPKKTKKEKLLARKHRSYLLPVAISHAPSMTKDEPVSRAQYSFSLPAKHTTRLSTETLAADFQTIKKDLTKTLIFTVGILMSEFLLARVLLNK